MNHLLQAIDRQDDVFELTFEVTKSANYVTRLTDEHRTVKARQVVLALPRTALESIDWAPIRPGGELRDAVRMVFKQTAFKIFLGYEVPWWHALGLQGGRSITDMPIRQTYYFGTEGAQKGGDPKNQHSLLMASYNDTGAVPFWKGLETGKPFVGRKVPFLESGADPVPPSDCVVTQPMVEMAQAQIARLHVLQNPPEPYTGVYQDWSRWPFGGGWHVWKAGYDFLGVLRSMPQPIAGQPIHICGEAYSAAQGWVEGALQTAEDVLAGPECPRYCSSNPKRSNPEQRAGAAVAKFQYYVPIETGLKEIADADRGRKRMSIVVLGAGIAGLVTARELQKLGHHVEILEGSQRIGGRIYTHYFGDGQYGELGAMRIPEGQTYTFHYIKECGLSVGRFYNSNPKAFYSAARHRHSHPGRAANAVSAVRSVGRRPRARRQRRRRGGDRQISRSFDQLAVRRGHTVAI